MKDIPGYETFLKIEPIRKGWSDDQKYSIETVDGGRMLLRVSDRSAHDRKKAEYERMARIHSLGVPTSKPLGFGLCDGGKSVYSLSGWIDGEDAETALPLLSEAEQYVFGLKAGEALRQIHTLPAPDAIAAWPERYFSVIGERIDAYRSKGLPFEGSETVLDYLEQKRGLLQSRPQCFLHGDFHEGNLMCGADRAPYVIDLLDEGFGNYGDPWYDFKAFGEADNAYFSTGLVRGYFRGEPPQEFWDVLTYYTVTAALTSIVWRKYHKPDDLPEALRRNEKYARFLCDGRSSVMEWYLKDFYI